jgi:hypothetical protein
MKKLITITLIFLSLICQSQVLDLKTYKKISKDYYFIGTTLYTRNSILAKNVSKIVGATKTVWMGGRGKIFVISGTVPCTLSGMEITTDSGGVAICGILISDSSTVTIENCNIHDVQWGIRAFQGFNSKIIVRYTKIYNTEDDGIFAQNTNDWDISYCHIYNVNKNYFTMRPGGGDCIQIAFRQGNIVIHHSILDHSSTGYKFCLITGSTDIIGGSLDLHDCILIGRSNADRLAEDPRTHKVMGNSCAYFKPLLNYKIYNVAFINGSNAFFEQGSNPCNLEAYNNYFQGQTEALVLVNLWNNTIYNNTFTQGITRYFKGSAKGDDIHNNYFSLDNFKENDIKSFFINQPKIFDYTLVPKKGYGCSENIIARKSGSFESNPCTVTVYDTITTYKIVDVPTPRYYDVPRDVIRYKDYYKLPFSIDSVMNKLINEHENQKIIIN